MKKSMSPAEYKEKFPEIKAAYEKYIKDKKNKHTMKMQQSAVTEETLKLTNNDAIEEHTYDEEITVVMKLYYDSNSNWMEIFQPDGKTLMMEKTRTELEEMSRQLKLKMIDWDNQEDEELYLQPEDVDINDLTSEFD